jgi:hypothetical protein
MKKFFLVILSFLFINLISTSQAVTGTSLKTEGSCSGTLADGSPVSFTYYSNFDGCSNVSKSAISFTSGIEGLLTGSRSFKGGRDFYNFPKYDLSFPDSTGNTSGTFGYRDANNERQTVELQCEVRDYSYADC